MPDGNWYYTTDGQQVLGPVTFDVLRQMAYGGHLHPTNLVCQEGASNWQAASTTGLFSVQLSRQGAYTPGQQAHAGWAAAQQVQQAQADDPLAALAAAGTDDASSYQASSSRRNINYRSSSGRGRPGASHAGMALAGFVLSLLFWPLGLILSAVALNSMKASHNDEGKGLAQAGLIISLCFLGISCIYFAMVASFISSIRF